MLNVLVGVHGVGKTTLLNILRKRDKRFFITDGFSRPVKRALVDHPNSGALEQRMINELTAWGWMTYLNQNVVSSRSLIDSIVYSEYYWHMSRWTGEILTLRNLFEKTKQKVNYFYIPIEFDLKSDGVRYINETDQKNIDYQLQLFLKEQDITFTTVKGSLERRIEILSENLTYTIQ